MKKEDAAPGGEHNREVEDAPAVFEVCLPEPDHLHKHLNRVDHCEDVVQDLEDVDDLLLHSVPGHGKYYSVEADADKDEHLEDSVLGDARHLITELVACFDHGFHRSEPVALDQNFTVFVLQVSHEVITREFLLLNIESVDDDTDEEVEDKEAADYHEE